ncbi:hypothetical protein CkaCkLH20_11411 [Colletotrichum karsti]|uniref:Uncharacterized protein n=1 Tax=Colletotrichum karsti TaxID=1095194 RepID=A0A9P6HV46_9PEZI|nr:uncharacterized protein CkaCkLH20_11411 [Colletotrichum karsti]KAF9870994.1 hypothetical protein CkaCkLH20_11411 [Colletotrichum karsti]
MMDNAASIPDTTDPSVDDPAAMPSPTRKVTGITSHRRIEPPSHEKIDRFELKLSLADGTTEWEPESKKSGGRARSMKYPKTWDVHHAEACRGKIFKSGPRKDYFVVELQVTYVGKPGTEWVEESTVPSNAYKALREEIKEQHGKSWSEWHLHLMGAANWENERASRSPVTAGKRGRGRPRKDKVAIDITPRSVKAIAARSPRTPAAPKTPRPLRSTDEASTPSKRKRPSESDDDEDYSPPQPKKRTVGDVYKGPSRRSQGKP